MRKGIIFIIAAILIILAIILFTMNLGEKSDSNLNENVNKAFSSGQNKSVGISIEDDTELGQNVIEIEASGFSPSSLEIRKGEIVTFFNRDVNQHWPASAVHPTHTFYPGSDINKCETSEENNIFDACKGLIQNEEWSFTFKEVGNWNYHDHLNPGLRGVVIVK